jgi:hypothetical protein
LRERGRERRTEKGFEAGGDSCVTGASGEEVGRERRSKVVVRIRVVRGWSGDRGNSGGRGRELRSGGWALRISEMRRKGRSCYNSFSSERGSCCREEASPIGILGTRRERDKVRRQVSRPCLC